MTTCNAAIPTGFVANSEDCDDGNAAIFTGATEICDGIDNNCNGQMDEGLPQFIYYSDTDGDGFGGIGLVISTCSDTPLPGFSVNNLDCDDTNAAINPDATEVLDNLDNDCNGLVDDISATHDVVLTVKTYPNPVREVLTIQLEAALGEAEMQLSNMEGKVVKTTRLDFASGQASLSFAGLPQGVYLLRIAELSGGRLWMQRVVKM